jgi:hypothetical protein
MGDSRRTDPDTYSAGVLNSIMPYALRYCTLIRSSDWVMPPSR